MNTDKLIWHIACDESGISGKKYYGFGSLWMRYQRRGDFVQIIRALREKHNCTDEIKWQKANSKRNVPFFHDLIDTFFKHQWLAFHCIVIQKSIVNKSFHDGDYDLAKMKHFTKLISTKIINVIKTHDDRDCTFRIEVDPLPSRYKKADEAFHVIANNMIHKSTAKKNVITSVVTKDSKKSENIQIADFLLGAVMSAYQGEPMSETKQELANRIANYLGWDTLLHDTWDSSRKFNIWYFYDPTKGPREIETKEVKLKYNLPVRKKIIKR